MRKIFKLFRKKPPFPYEQLVNPKRKIYIKNIPQLTKD